MSSIRQEVVRRGLYYLYAYLNMYPMSYTMNWEAFGTISNIIVVGALVIITAYYAREVRKQTVLAEKDRMKNKILEEINDVLTPTIYSLDKEITAIDKKKFFWYKAGEEGIFDNFSKIYGESYAFKDVFRKFPELEMIYRSHDSLYEKLNGLYTEIDVEIRTPKLKECIKKLVDKFNQSKEEVYKLRWDYFRAEKTVGYYLINNYDPKRSPDTIEPHIDFWEENKDECAEQNS
jgi:hypothetical protein